MDESLLGASDDENLWAEVARATQDVNLDDIDDDLGSDDMFREMDALLAQSGNTPTAESSASKPVSHGVSEKLYTDEVDVGKNRNLKLNHSSVVDIKL